MLDAVWRYRGCKYQQYDSAIEVYCSIRSPQNTHVVDSDPRLRKVQAVELVEIRQAIRVRNTNFSVKTLKSSCSGPLEPERDRDSALCASCIIAHGRVDNVGQVICWTFHILVILLGLV